MNCFHCYYPFVNVNENPEFMGYSIFDEHYNFEIYKFCSLNCGLRYIMDSKTELVKKLKHFFDFYSVDSKILKMALPIERLIYFGGDLDYTDYRKDFMRPDIYSINENIHYNSHIDLQNVSNDSETFLI
jgi:hypothetical protein